MTRNLLSDSRGQTNLDYSIAILIFVTFLASTFFIAGSPLVLESGAETVSLQSDAEQALVQIEVNALTDDAGRYDNEEIQSFINHDNPTTNTSIQSNLNVSVELRATNTDNKPSVFDGRGDNIRVGGKPPSFALYNTTKTSSVGGKPMRVEVSVWRERQ